jgi:hypothetical protein
MAGEFQVSGNNAEARFTLKLHRGDGMCLVAMKWKEEKPPRDFVGFAIEYKEPHGDKFFALKNRLSFPAPLANSIRTGSQPDSRRSKNSAGCIYRETRNFAASSSTKPLRCS